MRVAGGAACRAAFTRRPRKTAPKSQSRKGAKPNLLAGGNPQIAKAYCDAPAQAYIAAMPGWKRDVGRLIPSKHCFTKYVKVTFFRGMSLRPVPPDPFKSKNTRYLGIHEDDRLDEAQLAACVKEVAR